MRFQGKKFRLSGLYPAILGVVILLSFSRTLRAMPVPPSRSHWELRGAEGDLVALTNQERRIHGLRPSLILDAVLSRAAIEHSEEMAALNYFSHESPLPRNRTLLDRYRRAVRQLRLPRTLAYSVGENLYYRESSSPLGQEGLAEEAQKGFMESPSHRRNLLKANWRRIGVGIVEGWTAQGHHVWYVTVMFKN